METLFLIALIVFFAAFTQSLVGFGLGLISMALLPGIIGLRVASPLMAVVGIVIECITLARFRQDFNLRSVGRLIMASVVGVPFGIFLLRNVDEHLILRLLGAVILGYALYGLFNFRLPEIQHPRWAYGFGFLAGILSGAYNTSGPPIVIYGSCRHWPPAEFKSNLQGFFLVNSITVIIGHALNHGFTEAVWGGFLIALPALAVGLVTGFWLDRFIDPTLFRKLVLVVLALLGLRLIF